MTVGGIYTGSLNIRSNDSVNPVIVVPVTMNVIAPVFGVEISADQVAVVNPADVLTYTVTVTNTATSLRTLHRDVGYVCLCHESERECGWTAGDG